MRSYGQYCALAKSLDILGDRWTLLIVRELLLRGPCRYTDLRNGLPGIATNLLADRLRELEQAGVVSREDAPPPVATRVFRLTARGEQLRTVLYELGRWGVPMMADGPTPGDVFRGSWLTLPIDLFLTDRAPADPPIAIELRAGEEEAMTVEAGDGGVGIRPGTVDRPDAVVSGTPHLILGLLSGSLDLAEARERGVGYEGDPQVLRRVLPERLAHGVRAADPSA
jgi:DNA-binding HxlR family transcriptional regulator